MCSMNVMRKRSGVKDLILFQIFEDIINMEKNNCGSKFFTVSEKMTNEAAKIKLMEPYGLDPNMDLEAENTLIINKKSKLSSAKRTIIRFLSLVNKNGIYVENKPISVDVVDAPEVANTIADTVDTDHGFPIS